MNASTGKQCSTPPQKWKNCTKSDAELMYYEHETKSDAEPMYYEHETKSVPPNLKCRTHTGNATTDVVDCLNFYVHTSPNIEGPWSQPLQLPVLRGKTNVSGSWWSMKGASMPAPFIFPNGTTLVYFQARTCPPGWGNVSAKGVLLAL
jgi:hypothetical protein